VRKYSLSEWTAIAEIAGAIAVVVSWLYLGIQVREQNRESRLAAMRETAVGLREAYSEFTNINNAELLICGNKDYDELDDAEKLVLITLWTNVFRVWEEAFIQNSEGSLVGRNWEAVVRQVTTIFNASCVSRI